MIYAHKFRKPLHFFHFYPQYQEDPKYSPTLYLYEDILRNPYMWMYLPDGKFVEFFDIYFNNDLNLFRLPFEYNKYVIDRRLYNNLIYNEGQRKRNVYTQFEYNLFIKELFELYKKIQTIPLRLNKDQQTRDYARLNLYFVIYRIICGENLVKNFIYESFTLLDFVLGYIEQMSIEETSARLHDNKFYKFIKKNINDEPYKISNFSEKKSFNEYSQNKHILINLFNKFWYEAYNYPELHNDPNNYLMINFAFLLIMRKWHILARDNAIPPMLQKTNATK